MVRAPERALDLRRRPLERQEGCRPEEAPRDPVRAGVMVRVRVRVRVTHSEQTGPQRQGQTGRQVKE